MANAPQEEAPAYHLITDLCESRLFPSRGRLGRYTAKDVCDLLFLHILALQILRSEFDTLHVASAYARATLRWDDFAAFRSQATDLYVLAHQVLAGSPDDLRSNRSNELFLRSVTFDEVGFHRWLQRVWRNRHDRAADRRWLLAVQQQLDITEVGYRAIRRLAADWGETLGERERRLVMTRLLMAFRKRAPRSELLPYLEGLAKREKLEIKGASNPETGEGGEAAKPSLLAKLAAAGAGFLAGKALVSRERRD